MQNYFLENVNVKLLTGSKPIQDVKIVDYVLGYTGTFKKVLDILQKKYHGNVYSIKHSGNSNPLKLTGNSKLLSVKKYHFLSENNLFFYPVNDLNVGDYVALPKVKPKVLLNKEILYTSEFHDNAFSLLDFDMNKVYADRSHEIEYLNSYLGNILNYNNIDYFYQLIPKIISFCFMMSTDRAILICTDEDINIIKSLLYKVFKKQCKVKRLSDVKVYAPEKQVFVITIKDKNFINWFSYNFGFLMFNYNIPEWMFSISNESKLIFFEAFDIQNFIGGYSLISDLQAFFATVDIVTSIIEYEEGSNLFSLVNVENSFVTDNFVFFEVEDIKVNYYSEIDVYSLKIENDQSFVINSIIC